MKSAVKLSAPVGFPAGPSGGELAGAFAEFARAAARIAELLGAENAPVQFPAQIHEAKQAPPEWGVSVLECCNEFMTAKARKGVSDRYLRQIRTTLSSFAKGRTSLPLAEVTREDVEKWIRKSDWSPRTMRGNLDTVKTLFTWATRRGWIQKDNATWIELPADTSREKPIEIHTPEQARTVLETARVLDCGVMRILAIRYFAGVRSAEALRLREENILAEHGVIEIPAAKSKTRRRRIVKITPNLRAWLDLGGALIPTGDKTIRRVIFQSGVAWSQNATRKSWESYSVAKAGNQAMVAKEAGHSKAIQEGHYDAVALPRVAREYFNIFPEAKPRAIVVKQWGGVRRGQAQAEATAGTE